MRPEEKLRNAVGLAMRAGKIRSGDGVVEKLVKTGSVKLLLLDAAVSEATLERYRSLCARSGVPMARLDEAGACIGRPERKILAVTDGSFAGMILRLLPESEDSDEMKTMFRGTDRSEEDN